MQLCVPFPTVARITVGRLFGREYVRETSNEGTFMLHLDMPRLAFGSMQLQFAEFMARLR